MACGEAIEREYASLQSLAAARPTGHRTVQTEDLWLWVQTQTGGKFDDDAINAVLEEAGADDESNVTLAQFTRAVVQMFVAHFQEIDTQGHGFITPVRLAALRRRSSFATCAAPESWNTAVAGINAERPRYARCGRCSVSQQAAVQNALQQCVHLHSPHHILTTKEPSAGRAARRVL